MNKKMPSVPERLITIRNEIAGAKKEVADLKHTIASDSVIKERIEQELDSAAEETQALLPYHLFVGGTSFALGQFAKSAGELTSPSIEVGNEVITTLPPQLSLFHLMATFDRAKLEKELIDGAIYFAGLSKRPRMDAQQRAVTAGDLQQKIAALERDEELVCRELDATGKVTPRRADANPAIILATKDKLK